MAPHVPPWATDPSELVQALESDPQLIVIGAFLLAALLLRALPLSNHGGAAPQKPAQTIADDKRPSNVSWWRRQWWKLRPPFDLMTIDGLQIDRSRKPHCLWLGPTGAGKSQSVATVRLDYKRPTLVVTPDLSDPLRARADYVWTACVSAPVDFLIGSPTEVAERLTEVFRSGGTGAWKMTARRVTAQVIAGMDATGERRSLQRIGELLQDAVRNDRELKQVCAGWVERFLSTALQFGPSVAAGGIDLAELLNAGQTVVLENDAFKHPGLVGDIVALGLAEAMRLSDLVPGGFRLVFEEAGQLGDRIELADPFFRAGRRRRITVDALTQAESDLDEAIGANSATRVYFGQELQSLQKVAADRLGLDHRELHTARMRDFTAWVSHGKIRRLVRFPKPKRGVTRRVTIPHDFGRQGSGDTVERRSRTVMPIERMREVLPMLPPPSVTWQKYLDNTYREGGCLRWKGKHDPKGYGYIWLADQEKAPAVHRWRWEQAYGPIGRDPVTNKKLTLDHRRTCPKDCSELTHLELVTRGENSERRWRVLGVGK